MSDVDDIMEEACERSALLEAGANCKGAILVYFNESDGVARVKRFNMTYGDEAYLMAGAWAMFLRALTKEREDDGRN